MSKLDLLVSGQVYNYLTIIKEVEPREYACGKKIRFWLVECVCGEIKVVAGNKIISNKTKSCGCMANKLIGNANRTNKDRNAKLHSQYCDMRRRSRERIAKGESCLVNFKNYDEFADYAYANGWYEGCSVCRIGDVGHYEAGNIRFDTQASNAIEANAGHFKFVDPDGKIHEIYNLSEFCRNNGLHQALMSKVNSGERQHHKGWRKYVGQS